MTTKKSKNTKVRIAAVGDIHVRENDTGKWEEYFREVSEKADVLLLCGDLTDTGRVAEAEVLAHELKACSIPVVAVMGNHDYERDHQKGIRKTLIRENVHVLDGDCIVIDGVGFAGVKGFGGGFDKGMLGMFGEPMIKSFVQEAVDEALKLDGALARLDSENENIKKVVLLHYAPIKATVVGEPEQIFPFLGSSRLAEPLNRRDVIAAFHGHAHIGTLKGETSKGVKVFNVSKPILLKEGYEQPYFILEV
ncbi:Icc-related predicted phosphoesterase [Pontibacter aydingkolensis]|uniref:Metallophosphoesterase n=1 Tax=Pontibacter aydingkolensis TaxID=1911536 RepID=A0ABS7CS81_9BACT|nr:metallophosphoesterase [Pontibacter aydingkolensis]MBW7466698.1 metallophosphoesterase [Pontibacter aydingkolensis]